MTAVVNSMPENCKTALWTYKLRTKSFTQIWEHIYKYSTTYCCDRKSRAACAQSFAPWQQATIEIMLAISLTIACSRYIYNGFILHAHPVRDESHNQRNTTGEFAAILNKDSKSS